MMKMRGYHHYYQVGAPGVYSHLNRPVGETDEEGYASIGQLKPVLTRLDFVLYQKREKTPHFVIRADRDY